jgi:DNA/RNA endonuclease G (NUC1)
MANNSGKWNQLELFARDLTKKYAEVFIQTGPLWLPAANQNGRKYVTYEVIGPGNVAVPTHLYKACRMHALWLIVIG